MELEQVVGGRDEPPFGSDGASAASVKAAHAAVVFGVTEDGLDHGLATSVKRAAELTRDHVLAVADILHGARDARQIQLPGHLTAYRDGGVLKFRRTAG